MHDQPLGAARPGSIGLPLPGTLVEITAIDDPDRRLPIGQRGEICISGPQVMAGYEGRPEETAEACAAAACTPGRRATSTRTATCI